MRSMIHRVLRAALFVLLASVLSIGIVSCGGGGGGGAAATGDTVVLSVNGGAEVTYTKTADSDGFYGFDSNIIGQSDSSSDVFLDLYSGCANNTCDLEFTIIVYGAQINVAEPVVSGGHVVADYRLVGDGIYDQETSGSVTITRIDAVGGRIQGNFDFTVKTFTTGASKNVAGHFNVTRLL